MLITLNWIYVDFLDKGNNYRYFFVFTCGRLLLPTYACYIVTWRTRCMHDKPEFRALTTFWFSLNLTVLFLRIIT